MDLVRVNQMLATANWVQFVFGVSRARSLKVVGFEHVLESIRLPFLVRNVAWTHAPTRRFTERSSTSSDACPSCPTLKSHPHLNDHLFSSQRLSCDQISRPR